MLESLSVDSACAASGTGGKSILGRVNALILCGPADVSGDDRQQDAARGSTFSEPIYFAVHSSAGVWMDRVAASKTLGYA